MRQRILVVDDDGIYLGFMREILEGADYDVDVAETLQAARRAVGERAPDLVLVDIRLGAFNGLQLVSEMSGSAAPIPMIVVSGFDDPVLRADAAALGAPYLVKPVSSSLLLRTIANRLRGRPPQDVK